MDNNTLLPPNIVIVEDDPDLGPLFAEILDESGYTSLVINDGAAALEGILSARPALVILDMHLPHVSGFEVLEQIRADERLSDLRVIVASANAALVEKSKALADTALLKPISLDTLLTSIDSLIRRA